MEKDNKKERDKARRKFNELIRVRSKYFLLCGAYIIQHLAEHVCKLDKRLHAYRLQLQKEKEDKEAKRKEEEKRKNDEYTEKVRQWREHIRQQAEDQV